MRVRHGILSLATAATLVAVPLVAPAVHGPEAQQTETGTLAVSESLIHDVQHALREQGHDVETDGSWSADTRRALVSFQRQHGLEPTGTLNAETLTALHILAEPSGDQRSSQPRVNESLISDVQQALKEQGYQVQADGVWGGNTQQALRAFQREHELDASGELDTRTLAALHVVERAQAEQEQAQNEPEEGQLGKVINEVFK